MSHPQVATRMGVYAYMQRVMNGETGYQRISGYVRRNFPLLRLHAEELARFHYIKDGVQDVTLEQIYAALRMTGELSADEAIGLMTLEREAMVMMLPDGERDENFLPIEKGLLESYGRDFSVQLLVAASRRVRLEHELKGPGLLGASFGGIILMPYVEWLLRRAVSLEIKRLYFIARDGYLLQKMADTLIKSRGLKLETYYIHGSRRAWRMPSYMGRYGELRELVGWSYVQHIKYVDDLADVLHIPVEILCAHLPREYAVSGRPLSYQELSLCVYFLDRDPSFRQKLLESLADMQSMTVEYLQQSINTSDDNFAFVELGGGGFTQLCLAKIMQRFYKGQVRTFFYKMDRVRPSEGQCIFYDFFPSKLENDLVIEMVCRAPEGQTEGYKRECGRIVPVKKEGEAEQYLSHGYDKYVAGVEAFARAYAEATANIIPEPSIEASLYCMEFISCHADGEIMDFFASLPNTVSGREKRGCEFAPALTKKQVREIFITYDGGNPWDNYKGTDFDLSVKRSDIRIQRMVEKYRCKGEDIRRRWLRCYSLKQRSRWRVYPYSTLGNRFVIYGAGQKGRQLYEELKCDKAISVVQWLDSNYAELCRDWPVSGDIENLGQVPYDCIFIALGKKSPWQEVRQELLNREVPKDKIYTMQALDAWKEKWAGIMGSYISV